MQRVHPAHQYRRGSLASWLHPRGGGPGWPDGIAGRRRGGAAERQQGFVTRVPLISRQPVTRAPLVAVTWGPLPTQVLAPV